MRTALLLGANGLVGGELLERLAEDPAYDKITAFVRRPLSTTSTKVDLAFDCGHSKRRHARRFSSAR